MGFAGGGGGGVMVVADADLLQFVYLVLGYNGRSVNCRGSSQDEQTLF